MFYIILSIFFLENIFYHNIINRMFNEDYINIILIILIILFIFSYIIINNKNFFTNKNKRKNIVFTSAGDNTDFHINWCGNNRNYDVYCVYYGDNMDNYNKYKSVVDKIWQRKGSKFQNFYYVYSLSDNIFSSYERFFILDDDIVMSTDDINKMFLLSEEYDLWICQPSFNNISKISHPITKYNPGNILRYTSFVEVNAPLFSKKALTKFMKKYDPILIGWGIDYLYIWANGDTIEDKYAVIDSIQCINPHDNAKPSKKRELNNIEDVDLRIKYWIDIMNKYKIPENKYLT